MSTTKKEQVSDEKPVKEKLVITDTERAMARAMQDPVVRDRIIRNDVRKTMRKALRQN
ncbi:hypothetical protein M1590_03980 [Candidatus Marsarchaeota archaeon]|nr:hypothetical protein [Candidatus Marsarchaeota archaeon]